MAPHDVSIIIPCFNKVDYTVRCLTSLAEHTPADRYQVVIVDNASTDDTPLLCEQLEGDVVVIRNEENLGFARACNQGAAAATGRHLLFLNNDTECLPRWLEPMLEVIENEPEVGAVGSRLLFPDDTLQHAGVMVTEVEHGVAISATHAHYRKPKDFPPAMVRRDLDVVTAACVLFRREAFEQAGGFDEGYWNGYEDVDLCLSLRDVGWRVVYEPASCLYHHESVSGPERFRKVDANVQRMQDRWGGRHHPTLLVARRNALRPHPDFCRVHVQIVGPGTRSDASRTEAAARKLLRGRDTISVDLDAHPSSPSGAPEHADWVLTIQAGVIPHEALLDRLLIAGPLGSTASGPALSGPGLQHFANFVQTDRTDLRGRATALESMANGVAPAPRLEPICRLVRCGPIEDVPIFPGEIVVPAAYADVSRAAVLVGP